MEFWAAALLPFKVPLIILLTFSEKCELFKIRSSTVSPVSLDSGTLKLVSETKSKSYSSVTRYSLVVDS